MYTKAIAAIVIALALAALFWKGVTVGEKRVQAEWDADVARRTAEALAASEKARAKEQALQTKADKVRREKDAHIHALDLRLDESLKRLRNRPERPAAVAEVPDSAEAGPDAARCTGSGLFREDAEFLTREASRANSLAIRLRACEAGYGAAEESLNGSKD